VTALALSAIVFLLMLFTSCQVLRACGRFLNGS